MLALLGCTQHRPSSIHSALALRLKQANKTQGVLIEGEAVPETDIILAWSAPAVLQNAPVLRTRNSVVVVFDCAERLAELVPLLVIDHEPQGIREIAGKIFEQLSSKEMLALQHTPIDVLKPILDKRKSTGFLHTYNTYLYQISNKELREAIRNLIFAAMAGNVPLPQFLTKANSLVPKRGKAHDAALGLIAVVDSPSGEKLREAIHAVRNNLETREAAIVKYKVESYDLGYLLAQVHKLSKAKSHGKSSAKATAGVAPDQPAAKARRSIHN